MNVREAIEKRRSIRAYEAKDIEPEKLARVLEAAHLAPSARNRQDWKFIIVKDPKIKEKLATIARNQKFIAEAPVVIVACGIDCDYIMSCGQPAYTVDVSIAMSYITLQAVEEGLGTCWIGAFKEEEVKELLGIPKDVRIVGMLPLGYPLEVPPPKPRKPLSQIIVEDRWS